MKNQIRENLEALCQLSVVGRELGKAKISLAALKITSREQAEAFVGAVKAACLADNRITDELLTVTIFEDAVKAEAMKIIG